MEFDCKSFWPHHIQHPTHLVVLIAIAAVLTLILNPLLIYSLIKTKQTRTNTFRFIIAMSISDVLLGAIVMPSTAVTIVIREYYKDCLLDKATQFGFYLLGYFSFLMLISITFDRLYQLKRLRNSPKSLTQKQLAIFLISCISSTVIISCVSVVYISFKYQLALAIINSCFLGFLFGSYACLLHKVRIHNIVATKNLANSNFQGYASARIDTNTSKVVWVLLFALTIFYVPFNFITPWMVYIQYEKREVPNSVLSTATIWAYILIFVHTVVNALICLTSNRKTRRFVWSKFNKPSVNREIEIQTITRTIRTDMV